MLPEIDIAYYSDVFGGSFGEDIISPLLSEARERICGRICAVSLTEGQREGFMRAVCVQAEYMAQTGRFSVEKGASSIRLGDFSMSESGGTAKLTCAAAEDILENCGLLYRGF